MRKLPLGRSSTILAGYRARSTVLAEAVQVRPQRSPDPPCPELTGGNRLHPGSGQREEHQERLAGALDVVHSGGGREKIGQVLVDPCADGVDRPAAVILPVATHHAGHGGILCGMRAVTDGGVRYGCCTHPV